MFHSPYRVALLFYLGIFATLCLGESEREIVDLCRNNTGEIQHNKKNYKTWHFISSGCSLNGTLHFSYVNVSEYVWNPERDHIRSRLRVTGIPTPMWEKGEESEVKSVQISNTYSAVLTYDGRYGTPGEDSYFKIRYDFKKAGDVMLSATNDYYLLTSQEIPTTVTDPKNYKTYEGPSSQIGTYRNLAITFGVLFLITIILFLIALLRLRQVRNDCACAPSTKKVQENEDTYADIDNQTSSTYIREVRDNDLYNL